MPKEGQALAVNEDKGFFHEPTRPLPGIIAFGNYGTRYQIVIPLKPYIINRLTNRGDFTLDLQDANANEWIHLINSISFAPFVLVQQDLVFCNGIRMTLIYYKPQSRATSSYQTIEAQ